MCLCKQRIVALEVGKCFGMATNQIVVGLCRHFHARDECGHVCEALFQEFNELRFARAFLLVVEALDFL